MDVAVSGATGMIGSALSQKLKDVGHDVIALSHSKPSSEDTIRWDPQRGHIDASRLEGIDAVVHLAGEGLIGRWTPEKKRRIRDSRVEGTSLLSRTLAELSDRPPVMVSASAIGYYGDRGNELLTEESDPGRGFLSGVCREWEAAADPAREAGIRVVHPRFGVILSTKGGALATTLPIFKLGGGGKVGSGRQYWSWVDIDDVTGAITHAIDEAAVEGPVNVTSPNPVTNAEYTKILGRVLNRPTPFPLPAPAARALMGEVADEMLLASQRVEPAKLEESDYEFRYTELQGSLRHLLGR
jgi:uncharacterized protein (TIGR01777 family)